jgi:GNAT superfamily N-acetyltransferase
MTASPISRDGLRLHVTTKGRGETFERFFAGFDRAFVLPNEKEDREGFQTCLSLNHGPDYDRLSALYGPYREVCLVAEESGQEIGGANFIAMPIPGGPVTANLNYIFVNAAMRGRGYLAKLLRAAREIALELFSPMSSTALIFIEQNDPFRMSAQDYARDTEFTGLDQLDRLRIWSRLGARVVDFPYRQPPLSASSAVDDTLLYSVLGASAPRLDACVLHAHLRLFFGVSVLKGAALSGNEAAQSQLAALEQACAAKGSIALLDPDPLLADLKVRGGRTGGGATNFRDAIKSLPSR